MPPNPALDHFLVPTTDVSVAAGEAQEIKRRTNVVGIFRNEAGVLRLAGSILLEVHDEWQIAERRYLSEGSMAKLYETDNDGAETKEVGNQQGAARRLTSGRTDAEGHAGGHAGAPHFPTTLSGSRPARSGVRPTARVL